MFGYKYKAVAENQFPTQPNPTYQDVEISATQLTREDKPRLLQVRHSTILFIAILVSALVFYSVSHNTLKQQNPQTMQLSRNYHDVRNFDFLSPHVAYDSCSEFFEPDLFTCCADPSTPVLAGLDVVALTKLEPGSSPIWGDADIESLVQTARGFYKFFFASEENKQIFELDPSKYTPLFGGFAADEIANQNFGSKLAVSTLGPSSNVASWMTLDNHLIFTSGYFKYSPSLKQKLAVRALTNWQTLSISDLSEVFNTRCFTLIEDEETQQELEYQTRPVDLELAGDGKFDLKISDDLQLEIQTVTKPNKEQ